MITHDELRAAVARDYLNVVPVLALLFALDEGFPNSGPLLDAMWMSAGWLQIDFAEIRDRVGGTGSSLALIDAAHDIWNGDVRTSLNQVLHRCDRRRVGLFVLALQSSMERGRGPYSDQILKLLGLDR